MESSHVRSAACARTFEQHLRLYSLAAGAAGVSILALHSPASAEVVFTPVHAKISTGGQFPIDLNHDGVVDFLLIDRTSFETGVSCSFCGQNLNVTGQGNSGAAVVGQSRGTRRAASALTAGAVIGSSDTFLNAQNTPVLMASGFNDDNSFFNIYGKFSETKNRFLGLKFEIQGQVHFGWARFAVVAVKKNGSVPFIVALLNGFAYETVPNQAITAGATSSSSEVRLKSDRTGSSQSKQETATLGWLAGGYSAMSLWRREESNSEEQP
jgi:hypothetical protein